MSSVPIGVVVGMSWSLILSGLFVCVIWQVCCNSAMIVGSAMIVTVGGIMGVVPALVLMTGRVGVVPTLGVVAVTI